MLFISHIQVTVESNMREPEVTESSFLFTRWGKLGPSSGTRLDWHVQSSGHAWDLVRYRESGGDKLRLPLPASQKKSEHPAQQGGVEKHQPL